jgi:hypothetical protein
MASCCECGVETWDSINCGEFREQLRNCQHLYEDDNRRINTTEMDALRRSARVF